MLKANENDRSVQALVAWYIKPFHALLSFYTPRKDQKTSGFLMFSGVIERDLRHKMG